MTEEKINEIYHKYYRLVMKVANDILDDFEYARDISQEVFIAFLRKANDLDENRYREWFAVCAKRKAIDFKRKAYQKHEMAVKENVEDEETEDSGRSVRRKAGFHRDRMFSKFIMREFTGKLLREVEKHNKDWYEILIRSLILEESDEEIARALGITVNNVRAKKHRLREWLKKNYYTEYEDLKSTD